ncbi:hypothetical protein GCM10007989_36110 [Devosia pacifica]|uniref:Soluble ligand binding domain-containing protein n=1 Tax=Devosia pacifica TaxID=1335967 RepID=A0A918SDB4_9HYPH|nr:polysaccharide biosynthesis/export family protein [Devosia pacifica]GHA36761.1 hypothetical protein GCM10007989_36110 [Devosia pacifica]
MRAPKLLMTMLLVPLAACATTPEAIYPVETKGPYTLDTGDVLRVTVYGEEDLTNSYRVDDAGTISFPLVGTVAVRNTTTRGAADRVAAALANGFMRSPDVAVEVAEYRPFYIQGEVKNAGQFPYVYGMTLRAAISTAGGFTETAERDEAVIYRKNGSEMVKGTVGLDYPIFPDDTIVVKERWF